MIENYSHRGYANWRTTIEIYQLSQDSALDFLLLVSELHWDLTTSKGNKRYHSKNRSLNELSIKIQSLS